VIKKRTKPSAKRPDGPPPSTLGVGFSRGYRCRFPRLLILRSDSAAEVRPPMTMLWLRFITVRGPKILGDPRAVLDAKWIT